MTKTAEEVLAEVAERFHESADNALIQSLTAQLATERAKVAELVEGFGDFVGSPQSCKTWGLPDTEAVIIDTTLGKIKQARALIERMK